MKYEDNTIKLELGEIELMLDQGSYYYSPAFVTWLVEYKNKEKEIYCCKEVETLQAAFEQYNKWCKDFKGV